MLKEICVIITGFFFFASLILIGLAEHDKTAYKEAMTPKLGAYIQGYEYMERHR